MKHTNTHADLQKIGNAIRKARLQVGLKQETAAQQLNISRSMLSHYENGQVEGLSVVILIQMSRLYNCSIELLLQ